MTIREAMEIADRLKPNAYEKEDKLRWLSELDGAVYTEILKNHWPVPEAFSGYPEHTDLETVLLIPYPFEEIYRWYLEMKMDDANAELERYNNSAAKYNTYYQAFAAWYNRTHMPKQTADHFKL